MIVSPKTPFFAFWTYELRNFEKKFLEAMGPFAHIAVCTCNRFCPEKRSPASDAPLFTSKRAVDDAECRDGEDDPPLLDSRRDVQSQRRPVHDCGDLERLQGHLASDTVLQYSEDNMFLDE